MKKIFKAGFIPALFLFIFLFPSSVMAQGFPDLMGASPVDIGKFSAGIGMYEPEGGDSGIYGLARYEMSSLEFELDYGLDESFFLLCADYLYFIPTAEGVTQTSIALGGGVTFINDDPSADDSQFGPNFLGKIQFMDNYAFQVRYDLLGDDSDLWTFGISYAIN